MQIDSPVGQRWKVKRDALDERQRRLWVGIEAKVLGRGGCRCCRGGYGSLADHYRSGNPRNRGHGIERASAAFYP